MRLFIGIKTGCEDCLCLLQEQLKQKGRGRFTHRENMHLTLKFLGEMPPSRINEISQAMAHAVCAPFTLECRGVKLFGRNGIVSAEVGGDLFRLSSLASRLDSGLETAGFPGENRSFKAHITLARDFRAFPGEDIETIPFSPRSFSVTEMILFESTHEGGRLVYVPLFRQKLK